METIYLCPSVSDPPCPWEGDATEVLPHFEDVHRELLLYKNELEVPITDPSKQNFLMEYLKKVFLVQMKVYVDDKRFRKIKLFLRYLGEETSASLIRYSVVVECKNFTFSQKDTDIMWHAPDGSVVIDLENMLLFENVTPSCIKCHILLENVPQDDDDLFGEEVNGENTEEDKENCTNDDVFVQVLNVDFEREEALPNGHSDGYFTYQPICTEARNKTMSSSWMDSPIPSKRSLLSYSNSFNLGDMFKESNPGEVFEEKAILIFRNSDKTPSPVTPVKPTVQISQMLQCKSCGNVMTPPIFMCTFGHNVCGNCKPENCQYCYPLSQRVHLRNIDLEEKSRSIFHKCRFSSMCLEDSIPVCLIRKHEIMCKYMVYECPFDNFKGSYPEMESHFNILHASIVKRNTLVNEFSKESCFIIFHELGIYYFKSLVHNNRLNVSLKFCSRFSMYCRSEVTFTPKKGKVQKYILGKNGGEYASVINMADIKGYKLKKGVLSIFVN